MAKLTMPQHVAAAQRALDREYIGAGIVPPVTYSLAEITYTDGTKTEFMFKASPGIAGTLIRSMKEDGYLLLWNDTDTLCIRADYVREIAMRQVSADAKPGLGNP